MNILYKVLIDVYLQCSVNSEEELLSHLLLFIMHEYDICILRIKRDSFRHSDKDYFFIFSDNQVGDIHTEALAYTVNFG